jgi:NAD dependent epimerase/dehydratase family enzyme
VLISGSATGYYGDLGEVVVTEEEPPHNEFTSSSVTTTSPRSP